MKSKSFFGAALTAALFTTLSFAATSAKRVSVADLTLVNESVTPVATSMSGSRHGSGSGRGIGGGHGRGIGTGRVIHL